ncbi:hypothetical protein JWG40_10300 [Leptospira sp. 201903074]|uniref:hypothetical protein n=1 Tax=Leptospira abararensis TaxID=2810036 RepID=UPI001964C4B1|nr:hypothetical protein [Leptospira abararensis]MBM9547409.1 hypothetical protein [Leptospira abararensis]
MNKTHEPKDIALTNLTVNIENPRYELVGNQREAMQVMIDEQEDKILALANHIIIKGLNPSDLCIVTPHETEKGKYNVLEGNRRVATLKLLSNPLDINIEKKSFLNKMKKLHELFKKNPILSISCIVFKDPKDAIEWIKLKHTGENEGVGTVRWDAQQVARFDERIEGKSSISLQAIDFLKKSNLVEKELKGKLKSVPSSSLDRLLRDPSVQDVVGIKISNGNIQTELKEEEVIKGLQKIVSDLADKKIKVKDIYEKKDREKYLLEHFKKTHIPDKKNISTKPWELVSNSTTSTGTVISKAFKKVTKTSYDRKNVIPKDCIITIGNKEKRIHQIYLELRNLVTADFVNSSAVLLRVFIELSLDAFIENKKLSGISKNDELHKKADKVAQFLEDNQFMNKHELKAIRIAASSQNSILSVNTFHSYVHNRHFIPSPRDINVAWDNLQLFIQKLWENL